jgi:eukaryotic-like serine/threonine-protein kinase
MKACPQCNIRYPADSTFCFLDGASLVEIRDPLIGTTIAGRYKVEKVIGEGGMATVYRASQSHVDRACAIKVMNPALATDATVRERFRREAKSAQSLAHPNVIEIFEQGETDNGTPYMVMELLEGTTLADLIEHGRLPLGRGISVMIQMSRGIARAHDLGVIHRDLKPENTFLVRRPDGSDLVKILDFGIARSKTDTRLTNAGELFGTPQYLAPERITGGEAGSSVDLYALGVIFFEVATGKLPFNAPDPASMLIAHMTRSAPLARTFAQDIPERLEALIAALLEKDPRARPVDARRVEHDLTEIARALSVPVPAEPEREVASVRAPVKTMPELVSLQWARRIDVFEEMLAQANGAGASKDLTGTLESLRKVQGEIAETRAAIGHEQRKLEEIDARGRDGRQRFGAAVDALGIDSSKAKDEVRAAHAEEERLAVESKRERGAYEQALKEAVFWEGRSGMQEPYAQMAAAYRGCAEAVDSWLAVRKAERRAHDVFEDKTRMVSDLDYQIGELRAALTHHEQGTDRDREATRQRIVELHTEAERMEATLVQLATRFCEPLRARPELTPFFQRLEAEAVAQA